MADEKDDKNDSVSDNEQNEAQNVADLSVPKIVSALHQTAISKSDAKSKSARITNSAIEEKDGKSKINSAGEHIISVLPIDESKPVEKKIAIELLKTYVQWFVGPDLANKVNDSTVKSLTEAPGYEDKSKKEEKSEEEKTDKKEEKKEEKEVHESYKVMTFKQFLLEADSSSDDKSNDNLNDKKTNESKESKIGYYIPYSLKVEGLPQVALKDAMKKFAKTFFDDVTIKASGLFGGGDSFTVKDIKDKFKETFGAVNPEELVSNIEKEINSIRHPDTDRPQVNIRDKDTLILDLGNNIDAQQKKMIQSADYSVWIKLQEQDPKKPIFNKRVIADIVTGSIKGLFKKFKNKVTKNDVVYIQNYQDIHGDAKDLQKLNREVPTPEQVRAELLKGQSYADAFSKLERMFDRIAKKTNLIQKSPFASSCLNVWTTFKDTTEKNPQRKDNSPIRDKNKLNAFFKPFVDEYQKTYDEKKKGEDLYEAIDQAMAMSKLIGSLSDMKSLILESLFGNSINEDESDNKEDVEELDLTPLVKQHATIIFEDDGVDGIQAKNVEVNNKDTLVSLLKVFEDTSSMFGDFNNGIVVDFSTKTSKDKEKTLDESIVKDQIMSILFEKDKINDAKYPSEEAVKKAFDILCQKANLKDDQHGEVHALRYNKELSEAEKDNKDNEKLTSNQLINIQNAFETNIASKILSHKKDKDDKKESNDEFKKQIHKQIKVGTYDDIISFINNYELYNNKISELKDIADYYAIAFVKNARKVEKADGSIANCHGTTGNKYFTIDAFKKQLINSIDDKNKKIEIVDNVIDYTQQSKLNPGVSQTTLYYSGLKDLDKRAADPRWKADCHVIVAAFNVKDDGTEPPGPGPGPGEDRKNNPEAYLMPFGGKKIEPPTINVEQNNENDNKNKGEDLYIIPMPGLRFNDKEYNTYAK